MTRDDLYGAAFRFKNSKLWKKLGSDEIFGIRLESGEIAFLCVMGKNADYRGLGIYLGDWFQSYWKTIGYEQVNGDYFRENETLLQQRCIHMVLEDKEGLSPEEVEEVRSYAARNGIKLAGRKAYPQFVRFEPNYSPWGVVNPVEEKAIHEALEASVLMAEILQNKKPWELEISAIFPGSDEVPLFEVKDGKLISIGMTALPPEQKESYEYVRAMNDIAIASVKRLMKSGVWELGLVRMSVPVQLDMEGPPYFPLVLLAAERDSFYILPITTEENADENPQAILQAFAETWTEHGSCPREVLCRDERTYAVLKDFCERTGVKISIYDGEMPALDEAESVLYEHLEGDEGFDEEMLESILDMDEMDLSLMPSSLRNHLRMLIEEMEMPEDYRERLLAKLEDPEI